MSVPDFQALMLPVLNAAKNGEICISDIRNCIAEKLGLTDEDN